MKDVMDRRTIHENISKKDFCLPLRDCPSALRTGQGIRNFVGEEVCSEKFVNSLPCIVTKNQSFVRVRFGQKPSQCHICV